ncbi:MAG: hypothetical protein ACREUE_05215 [Panacagrimonas sp.]
MITFSPYPITINGSTKDERIRADVKRRLEARNLSEPERIGEEIKELIRLQPNDWDYVAENTPQARHYEERVRSFLNEIRRNEVGRCVLDFCMGADPIWIIPFDSAQIENAGGSFDANVTRSHKSFGGKQAVRVAYTPGHWTFAADGKLPGARADEVLFHEMVHAYRFASPRVPARNYDELPHNTDHEEFLAHQAANVYRSLKGARVFNIHYKGKQLASAAECEKGLKSIPGLLEALEGFLRTDPLSKAIARIRTLYNPFADIDRLRRERDESRRGVHPGRTLPPPAR